MNSFDRFLWVDLLHLIFITYQSLCFEGNRRHLLPENQKMQRCNHYNVHFKLPLALLALSAFC